MNRRSTASCRRRRSGEWKAGFGSFWPKGNHFLGTVGAIVPGEVAPIAVAAAPGVQLATGVLVLYADDLSFTFMTPQGHMFGGWITFSASQGASGTELDIAILMRAGDPLYEIAMPIMMRKEDQAWSAVLGSLSRHLGATSVNVREETTVVDWRRLWRNWVNVWHNAGIRSVLWTSHRPCEPSRRGCGRRGQGDPAREESAVVSIVISCSNATA